MTEDEGHSKAVRGFFLVVFVAIAGVSLLLGVAVCLVALFVLLVGDGEARSAALGFVIAGAGWAVFGWRLLTWVRQQRWP
jgi:hypothetical protein